jgi:mono/diheme cytochrome c family protein
LLPGATTEDIEVKDATGMAHTQTWYFPSREDCLTCHTARAGRVLGLKTRQLNRSIVYPSGISDNQLRTWNHLQLFSPALVESDIGSLPALAAADDETRSLEDRARSYLDANCSQCHRPGGTVANFDARYDTPLAAQALVDGPVLIDQGLDHPRVVAPHDIWRSVLYMRINTNDDIRMPPLARETIDVKGVKLLGDWIKSLPGRDVLAPPTYSPAGGTYLKPVTVTLASDEPGADIHYTLDGSVPGLSDPRYTQPLQISGNLVLRARAFKVGFTRSIAAQQLFIVGN